MKNVLAYYKEDICEAKCKAENKCDGWVYRYPNDTVSDPECNLKSDLPTELIADSQYVTGFNVEIDSICGDCHPENKSLYLC